MVGVEAPWNLFGMMVADSELVLLEGRALLPGIRRVALALTEEPALADRLAEGEADGLEAAVALLANERPLAEETGRRILDLYCGSPDGSLVGLCFEKLSLLYAGPDDPSLQSMEADVGGLVVESLVGLVEEAERQCGVLAALEADVSSAAGGRLDPGRETRRRIWDIGYELQDVLALVGRLDSVPRAVLEGVFEFWSTERLPEARRILEENDWLEPDVAAVPRHFNPVAELCEGRI